MPLSYAQHVTLPLSHAQRVTSYLMPLSQHVTSQLSHAQRVTSYLMPLSHAQRVASYLMLLSHAQHVTSYTVSHYGCTNEKHVLSYPPCLGSQGTFENCMCMFSASVRDDLLRIMDIILSFFNQLNSDSILIKLFLQVGRHGFYIGYDCLYLSRNSSHICLALNLRFQQTLHTKHDFRELKKRLIGRFASLQGIQSLQTLATFFRNCICWQKHRRRLTTRFKSKFNQRIRNGLHLQFLSDIRPGSSDRPSCQNKHQDCQRTYDLNLGGAASRLFDFSLIGDYLTRTSDRSLVSQDSVFRFVDHVDDVGILAYSSPQFVRTNIPLKELFKFLPVSHARKIASIHCIPSGSRCSIAELLIHVENHSCLQCSSHLTVFSIEKNNDQLNRERVTKCRERKLKLQENEISTSVASDFPPFPATTDLTDLILSKACKKMHPKAIEEAGCAVCGELKPLQKMSRLKSVKNFLRILEAPGVTRIERRTNARIIKEYTGPVLDYACSHICDSCRKDVRT